MTPMTTAEHVSAEHVAQVWTQVDALAHELLVPIENEAHYRQVLAAVDDLMSRVGDPESRPHPLESLLGILIDRIAAYEEALLPIRARRPEAVLAYLMADRQLTQTDLARHTGIDQSTLSKLLKTERALSKAHGKKLAAYFQINPEVFLD